MEIIKLNKRNIREVTLNATKVVKNGGVILYPTDTLYGLGVDAENPKAIRLLKKIKGRDAKKPISILVSGIPMIKKYGKLNKTALSLAEKFLPGPLTLVLEAKNNILKEISNNGKVGMRIPKELFCLEIMKVYKNPITTTSANISGLETKNEISAILSQLGEKVKDITLAIDNGTLNGKASTIVSVVSKKPEILREGKIPAKKIISYINEPSK